LPTRHRGDDALEASTPAASALKLPDFRDSRLAREWTGHGKNVSPFSVPEFVAEQLPAKQLGLDGTATPGTLTMTNHRMFWTRRSSPLSKVPARPSAQVYWPELAAVVEHRIEKHSLFVAERRSGAERLRFWLTESDGARLRGHLGQLGFDTHAWA
jgi:hypothetical protein